MTTTHSFFRSRWVEGPGNVTELPGGLPRGFQAAGVACGIKPSGGLDLGLLVSERAGHDERGAIHSLRDAVRTRAAVPRAGHARRHPC